MDAPVPSRTALGRALLERAAALASHSDSADHYTRTYLTSAHQAAARVIAGWMEEAGMAVRVDAMGSVVGRYEASARDAKTLLMGSHFDSVRNGGKYDGVSSMSALSPSATLARTSPVDGS